MIVIGIVGVPAGGKSTVAGHLAGKGAAWLDADRLAHRCLALRQVRRQLTAHFGPEVLGPHGFIDRGRLAARVFGADDQAAGELKFLERVVHPPTRDLLFRRLCHAAWRESSAAVLDVPLLFEAGLDVYCDVIWCIDAPLAQRQGWLAKRGWTVEQLEARENRQLEIREKRRLSNHVIVNRGGQAALAAEIDQLWAPLIARFDPDFEPQHCRPQRRERVG